MINRRAFVIAGALALLGGWAPSASADYSSWPTLTAYEGGIAKASGKGGAQGANLTDDRFGAWGYIKDLRPGGSPARIHVPFQYGRAKDTYAASGYLTGYNSNDTSTWRYTDAWRYELDLSYDWIRTKAEVCQDDPWPNRDDCTSEQHYKLTQWR